MFRRHDNKLKYCSAINDKLLRGFQRFGHAIGEHAWKVITLCVLINMVFGLAACWLKVEIQMENQFRPDSSQAERDQEVLNQSLSDDGYHYQRQLVDAKGYMEIVYSPGDIIDQQKVFLYTDLLVNVTSGGTCPNSPYNVSGFDTSCDGYDSVIVFRSEPFRNYSESTECINYPYVYSTNEMRNVRYASYIKDTSRNLSSITAVKWIFWTEYSDYRNQLDHVRSYLSSQSPDVRSHLYVYTDELRDIRLYNDFKNVGPRLGAAILLMYFVAIIMIWPANNSNVWNPVLLLLAQFLSTAMATCSGLGFGVFLGIKVNVFALTTVPIVTQVLGLIRLFVQLSNMADNPRQITTKEKIGGLMLTTCLGITLSYVLEAGVMIACVCSSLSGLRHIGCYLGVAGLMGFINQITFIPACLSLFDRRALLGRHFLCCNRDKETRSRMAVPKSKVKTESYVGRLFQYTINSVALSRPFQIAFSVLFVSYISLLVWNAFDMEQNDRVPRMGSPSSNIRKFFEADHGFEHSISISFTIHEKINYSSSENQGHVNDLIRQAQGDPNVHENYPINWSGEYMNMSMITYLIVNSDNTSTLPHCPSNTSRVDTNDSMYYYCGDVYLKGDDVVYSRFYVLGIGLTNSKVKSDLMSRMRKIASNSPLPVTVFAPEFLKYEQYASILPELLTALGIPMACFLFLFFLLLPVDLFGIVHIAFSALTTLVCIFGFMSILTIHYNFVTMIPVLVMSVVSISVSVLVSFEHAQNGYPENGGHVTQTVCTTLVPILKACVCILIGLLYITDSTSYVLYSMFCIFMIGFVNIVLQQIVLFPVVRNIFGDGCRGKVHPVIFTSNPTTTKKRTDTSISWIDYY